MSQSYPSSESQKKTGGRPVLSWRLAAVLVMVLGAAGFAVGLFFFDQQVSCLAVSTLVTLGGLALNIAAKKRGWLQKPVGSETESLRQPEQVRRRAYTRAPRGLRTPPRVSAMQAPMTDSLTTAHQNTPAADQTSSLLSKVVVILESQDALVSVESKRDNRGILRIVTGQGQRYIAMTISTNVPIGVADVRSLRALIHGSGSTRGYLIAGNGFTQAAYEWAEGQTQIRLVGEDELDELGI